MPCSNTMACMIQKQGRKTFTRVCIPGTLFDTAPGPGHFSLMPLVHATCVAVDAAGVLIRGPSGSGKSDLALRLIDEGATLVADDYCEVGVNGEQLIATPPETISGRMEVRGYGIVSLPFTSPITVKLVVDLTPQQDIERYPESSPYTFEGVIVNRIELDATTASATAKIRLALKVAPEDTATS